MCDLDDYDRPKVYSREARKARKPHRCSECGKTIEKGERYMSTSGLWEDHWSSYAECRRCAQLVALMVAAKEPFLHGQVHEQLRECVRYEGKGVLGRMREAHRNGVGKEWRAA